MKSYSINTLDTETSPAWMSIAAKVTPGAQDSGRCRFAVEVEDALAEALEAALDADTDVLSYDAQGAIAADLVLCESPDGFSLHAPGSTDEEIATGDAPYLVSGPGKPSDADYARALDVLRERA